MTPKSFRAIIASAILGSAPVGAAEHWREESTGMIFVEIAKGCFRMGSSKPIPPPPDGFWRRISYKNSANADELPAHEVCLDRFWIGKYEITVDEWRAVMGNTTATDSPTAEMAAARNAIGGITWTQAQTFATRLGERSGGKHRYRLPTEAEWEYACRAGDHNDQIDEEKLSGIARFAIDEVAKAVPHPVGQLAANAFGLHDMLGNVWEWTADSYAADAYAKHRLHAPRVDADGRPKVIRGGSARSEMIQMRCAMRGHQDAEELLPLTGFRLVRER